MSTNKPSQHSVTTISLTDEIVSVVQLIDQYFSLGMKIARKSVTIKLAHSTFYTIKNKKQNSVGINTIEKIVTYVQENIDDLSKDQKIILVNKMTKLIPFIPSLKGWIKEMNIPQMNAPKKEQEIFATPSIPDTSNQVSISKEDIAEKDTGSTIIDVDNLSSEELLNLIEKFKEKRLQEVFSQRVQNGIALYMKWKGLATTGQHIPFERLVQAIVPKGYMYFDHKRVQVPGEGESAYMTLKDSKEWIFKEDYDYLTTLSKELEKDIILQKKQNYFEVFISA